TKDGSKPEGGHKPLSTKYETQEGANVNVKTRSLPSSPDRTRASLYSAIGLAVRRIGGPLGRAFRKLDRHSGGLVNLMDAHILHLPVGPDDTEANIAAKFGGDLRPTTNLIICR